MGMALDAGGHLTHGIKSLFQGKYYNSVTMVWMQEGILTMQGLER
jgi:glycine/serine hydroxymethyltransferase